MRGASLALLAFAAAAGPAASSGLPKPGNLEIDIPKSLKPSLPAPPDLADKPKLSLTKIERSNSLPDITIKKGGGAPKFVKAEGTSKININVPGMKPLPDIEIEKPDPLPKLVIAKPGKANFTFQGPKKLVIEKPNPPDVAITKVTPPKDKIVIPKPVKLAGTININKGSTISTQKTTVNISKPAFNFNVTVSKKQKPAVRPFFQPGNLNVSVLKFDKFEDFEYSYVKPPQNFSITFVKPLKPRWSKGDNGTWTETKESKGLTLSGQIQPPGGAGPLEGVFGERTVCRFRKGSNQPQFMEVVKAPAVLANKMADDDLYSFIAPPYGVKVFGPDCYTYDWKCQYNYGLPCSGHGNCISTFPNQCMCFQGYATCKPPGATNGCETNLYRDPLNCGACGYACPAGTPICCGMFGCVDTQEACNNLNTTRQTSYLPDRVRSPGSGGAAGPPVTGVVSPTATVISAPQAPVDGANRARAGGSDPANNRYARGGGYAGNVGAGTLPSGGMGRLGGSSSSGGSSRRTRPGESAADADMAAAMSGAGDDTSAEDAVAASADPGLGAVGGKAAGGAAPNVDGAGLPVADVEAGMPPQAYAVPGGMTASDAAAARAASAAAWNAAASGGGAAPAGGEHGGHDAPASASSAPHAGHSQFAPMPGGEAVSAPKAGDAVDVPPPDPVQALIAGRP